MPITAQDLYNYTRCAHRVYLDANGNPEDKTAVSAFVELLWERGLQIEKEYLATLGAQEYENLETLPIAAACERTLELMQAGAPLVYQGALQSGDWLGRPDLLVKRAGGRSRFGGFYYEPIDIKAGRGWEVRSGKKPRFKTHYAFQLLFYREIMKKIQGCAPPPARIINVDKEIEEFDPMPFENRFCEALEQVGHLIAGTDKSEPVLGSGCHQCHWYAHCRRWVEGTRDPSSLFFVGRVKFDLKRVGLTTIYDIARMNVDEYIEGPKKIPRMGKASLCRMKERAKVKVAGKPVIRPGFTFPEEKREIYFDIEDDPTRDVTYLFGLLERKGPQDFTFRYFLAKSPAEEEQTIRAFWEFLELTKDAVYYVYSPKERSTLKKLMARYKLDETVFERYVEAEYDLYTDLVVKYSDWPTYSYGIKQIAQFAGFRWRDTDPGGANSIAWFNDYLQHPDNEAILQRILDYNEDDCRAMVAVKDYFEARRGRPEGEDRSLIY